MNPYAPPQSPAAATRSCALCDQWVEWKSSPLQRVRCKGCGCLQSLQLPAPWRHALNVVLIACFIGLFWLPAGIVLKSVILLMLTMLYSAAFLFATSIAGKLWPLRNGLFVSLRSLEIARSHYRRRFLGPKQTAADAFKSVVNVRR